VAVVAVTGPAAVRIPAGTVVELPPGTWRYGDGLLRLRVERVLHELSRFYTDEVWLEGTRLDPLRPGQWIQVLARIDALPVQSAAAPLDSAGPLIEG
jgi:hypothetical protein